MAQISIPAGWFASVNQYLDTLQADTVAAAESAVAYLHDRVVERAQDIPEWSDLADDITVWSQDGYLFIGVNNQERVSEAMALEYGDEVRPPSALFRSLSEDVRAANQRWREQMEAKGWTYGTKVKM